MIETLARRKKGVILLIGALFLFLAACQTTYYAVWEKLGKEKRHLLKAEVEKARGDQQKASEQFQDVLSRIREMYGFSGGELETFYERLRDDYEACENRAATIRHRIVEVDQIGGDLFEEWEAEIGQISNADLRSKSRKSLDLTKRRFDRLQAAMRQAESRLNPVLVNLKDYVLYLKHNLNAQSIGALRQEVKAIETDVGTLLDDIGKSIREAEDFLKTFD